MTARGAKEPLEQVKTYGQNLGGWLIAPARTWPIQPKIYYTTIVVPMISWWPSRRDDQQNNAAIPAFLGKRRHHHYQTLSVPPTLVCRKGALVEASVTTIPRVACPNPIFSWHLDGGALLCWPRYNGHGQEAKKFL